MKNIWKSFVVWVQKVRLAYNGWEKVGTKHGERWADPVKLVSEGTVCFY